MVRARPNPIAKLARAIRLVAGVAAFGVLSVTVASCRDVLIGDRLDAAADICALLQDCYGDEYRCDVIEADLRSASPEVRASFLQAFKVDACLGSCPGARVCLDTEPFCAQGGSCEFDHDCCDWSIGEAACGAGEVEGKCCKPNGVVCGEGDLCCDAQCREGSCGGYECTPIDETCTKDSDCCSLYCKETICSVQDCAFPGEPCQTVEDCCPDAAITQEATATLVCESGVCGIGDGPFCLPDGELCSASSQCCPDLESQCLQAGPDFGFCAPPSCERGAECTIEGECCEGYECVTGFCYEIMPGCSERGLFCVADNCCAGLSCLDGFCEVPPNCVAGRSEPPERWSCSPSFYDMCDGCDCSCGTHDPDCDALGQQLYCEGSRAGPGFVCDANDICVLRSEQ